MRRPYIRKYRGILAAAVLVLAMGPMGLGQCCGYPGGPVCPAGNASPILIDIDGTGLQLTSATDGVRFDIAGTGTPIQMAWTAAGAKSAFLALDRNGNGAIDNGKELFGNFTSQPHCSHPNGFLALAQFDKVEIGGNADGTIDSSDSVFNSLRLWIDKNHNGISETSELYTLLSLGVQSLSLDYREAGRKDRYGNKYRYRAKVNFATTETGPWAYDIFFATSSAALPARDPKRTILGAKTPQLIPTDVVTHIFFRVAACPNRPTPLQKKKCELVRRAVGLTGNDEKSLVLHLQRFIADVSPLDEQIAELGRRRAYDSTTWLALVDKRKEVVRARSLSMRGDLSPEGKQRFDSYLAQMKSKTRYVPGGTAKQ